MKINKFHANSDEFAALSFIRAIKAVFNLPGGDSNFSLQVYLHIYWRGGGRTVAEADEVQQSLSYGGSLLSFSSETHGFPPKLIYQNGCHRLLPPF